MTDPLTYVLACLRRSADNAYPWSLTPAEAGALVSEVERLRTQVADYRLMIDGLETAAHEERAAVVAYLRKQANAPHPIERGVPSLSPAGRGLLLFHADRCERGEHRRKEKP